MTVIKTILAIFVPVWIGSAIGAAIDHTGFEFWFLWAIGGITLGVLTTIFVLNQRVES
jgi:hypothetical protein